jgi:hypothetical protein
MLLPLIRAILFIRVICGLFRLRLFRPGAGYIVKAKSSHSGYLVVFNGDSAWFAIGVISKIVSGFPQYFLKLMHRSVRTSSYQLS